MSAPPTPQPLYLTCEPDPAFATLHPACEETARDTAVILCPPFGWEGVCAYRSLRFWAQRLAQAGYPTLRLSLPGGDDSGGNPRDPGRVDAWLAALGTAASSLAGQTGTRRVVLVGLGLGGMLGCLAAGEGVAIDDLVLWGAPARGRALVRQLRVFAKLEHAQLYEGVDAPPEPPPGEIEAGGFVLSAETVHRLEQIDLAQMPLRDAARRRALLLERDGLRVDTALREHLQQAGVAVTVATGDGFADMTSHPQTARPPLAVIDRVSEWLGGGSAARAPAGAAAGEMSAVTTAEISVGPGGETVRETPIAITQSFGRLSGVLVEPIREPGHGLCVVLLNAGAIRRIGPNRAWVEAARRWALHGVPTLRLDAEAIGDSDGDETPYRNDGALYTPGFVPQVISALDFLQARGVGRRFVLGGLCAGANWSFHALIDDPRVCAAMLINPRALIYTPELGPGRDFRALLSQPLSLSKIRRLATGPRLHAFLRWVAAMPGRWLRRLRAGEPLSASTGRELDLALGRLLKSGKRTLWLFSDHEPLFDELSRFGRMQRLSASADVTVEHIAVHDHTMRPVWAQRLLHAALDRALARELGTPPHGAGGIPRPATGGCDG